MTAILSFGQAPSPQKRSLPNGQTVGDVLAQKTYEPNNPRHRAMLKDQAQRLIRLMREKAKIPLEQVSLEATGTPAPIIQINVPTQQAQAEAEAYLAQLRPEDPAHPFELFPFITVVLQTQRS
jgi:hypothetical protein